MMKGNVSLAEWSNFNAPDYADGNPFVYIRLSHRIYLLRSYGSSWIESNGTPEGEAQARTMSALISVED